jgi:hypothetical protein
MDMRAKDIFKHVLQSTSINPLKNNRIFHLGMLLVLLGFLLMGTYHIFTYNFTSDEVAHLSAAHSYQFGMGLNHEHPPLLKGLNSLYLQAAIPKMPCSEANQWLCSTELISRQPENFAKIVRGSRFIYLFFNSIPLLWLWFYGYKHFLPRGCVLAGVVIYGFSPSIVSHASLITFDVAGSWSAALFIVSFTLLIADQIQHQTAKIKWSFLSTMLLFLVALGTKFSNVLLIIPFVFGLTFVLSRAVYKRQFDQLKYWSIYILGQCAVIAIGLWAMFAGSFRYVTVRNLLYDDIFSARIYFENDNIAFNLPGWLEMEPFKSYAHYIDGFWLSARRSKDVQTVFVDGTFVKINYQELVSRVFWFKELPVLLIMALVCFTSLYFFRRKIASYLQKDWRIASLVTLFFFPAVYWYISKGSYLTIGYRHFYPVLIFIYGALAFGMGELLIHKRRLVSVGAYGLLCAYALSGVVASSQGLTYVSELWPKEKYELASDATIYWGESEQEALQYLDSIDKLPSKNDNFVLLGTWEQNARPKTTLIPIRPDFSAESTRSYDQRLDIVWTDITVQKYRNYKYLTVDATKLQDLVYRAEVGKQEIPQRNLDFIRRQKMIKNINDVYWIYQLHE